MPETLEERIEASEKKLAKLQAAADVCRARIEDHERLLEKTADERERRHLRNEIDSARDTIRRKEYDAGRCLAYLERLRAQKEREWPIPEIFHGFIRDLVAAWDISRQKRRDKILGQGKAYYKKGDDGYNWEKYNIYTRMQNETDEKIHREDVREAEALVRNLIERIRKETGEITDFSCLRIADGNAFKDGGSVLNGLVRGEKGAVMVESIFAGGYNIQKEHVRVLVKKLDQAAPAM